MDKMKLMCVVPYECYVDSSSGVWKTAPVLENKNCIICNKEINGGAYASKDEEIYMHKDCVDIIFPGPVFRIYELSQETLNLRDFRHVLKVANDEFVRHQEKKGDDWLQCEFNDLFTGLAKGYAQLILATTEESVDSFGKSYIETLKLMLMCMMVAERYRRMILEDEDEDYIPF